MGWPVPSARMSSFSVVSDGDGAHSLLEDAPAPAYSNMTVRRAFVVWAHGGQANDFKQVCDYYHRLEALENTYTSEQRFQSRFLEFELLAGNTPRSQFQKSYFPKLYGQSNNNKTSFINNDQDAMSFDERLFTLKGFLDLRVHNGVTTKEVVATSDIIRRYCKEHSVSLKELLVQYQTYNKKCELENTLNNLSIYIKKLYLKDQLVLYHNVRNMPKQLSFLESDDDDVSKPFRKAVKRPTAVKKSKVKTVTPHGRKPNVIDNLLLSLPHLTGVKLASSPQNLGSPCTPSTPPTLCTPCSPIPPFILNNQQSWTVHNPQPISPYPQSLPSYSPQSFTSFSAQSWSPYKAQSVTSYTPPPLSAYSPQFRAFMAQFLQGIDISSINVN